MKGDSVVAEEWKFVGRQDRILLLYRCTMALTNYNIDCLFFPLADNLYSFVHYIYLLIHLWV